MEFTSEMQDKLIDMRFAFDRDLVRRMGYKAFGKHDIMGLCERCAKVIEKTVSHQKYCPECRKIVRREQVLAAVRKHREGKTPQTESTKKIAQEEVITPDYWTNLMLALVQNAAAEGDEVWLEENKDIYTQAILGRSLDG